MGTGAYHRKCGVVTGCYECSRSTPTTERPLTGGRLTVVVAEEIWGTLCREGRCGAGWRMDMPDDAVEARDG